MTDKPKRGFAAMSEARRREISAKGGKAVAPEKRGFARNKELASSAGKVGGAISKRTK